MGAEVFADSGSHVASALLRGPSPSSLVPSDKVILKEVIPDLGNSRVLRVYPSSQAIEMHGMNGLFSHTYTPAEWRLVEPFLYETPPGTPRALSEASRFATRVGWSSVTRYLGSVAKLLTVRNGKVTALLFNTDGRGGSSSFRLDVDGIYRALPEEVPELARPIGTRRFDVQVARTGWEWSPKVLSFYEKLPDDKKIQPEEDDWGTLNADDAATIAGLLGDMEDTGATSEAALLAASMAVQEIMKENQGAAFSQEGDGVSPNGVAHVEELGLDANLTDEVLARRVTFAEDMRRLGAAGRAAIVRAARGDTGGQDRASILTYRFRQLVVNSPEDLKPGNLLPGDLEKIIAYMDGGLRVSLEKIAATDKE